MRTSKRIMVITSDKHLLGVMSMLLGLERLQKAAQGYFEPQKCFLCPTNIGYVQMYSVGITVQTCDCRYGVTTAYLCFQFSKYTTNILLFGKITLHINIYYLLMTAQSCATDTAAKIMCHFCILYITGGHFYSK